MSSDGPDTETEKIIIRRRSQSRKPETIEGPVQDSPITVTNHEKLLTPRLHLGRQAIVWLLLLTTLLIFFAAAIEHLDPTWRQPSVIDILSSQSYTVNDSGHLDIILAPNPKVNREAQILDLRWNVTKGLRSPDGVEKLVYQINGEFPAPTIEARAGDIVNLELFNGLEKDDLAIHFHGLEMRGYNDMDGAVGVTQDPIPAGGNMTYRFTISEQQTGTFWYHAHSQVQRGDGLFGSFIIHPRRTTADGTPEDSRLQYVDEERVIMISDWYHRSAKEALSWYMRSGSFGMEPVPDSILINGIGAFNCSNAAPARPVKCVTILELRMPTMHFEAGKTYRLRFINTGMLAGLTVSIPGLAMTIIEIDGGERVQAIKTTSFGNLFPGQRVDVLVKWPAGGDYELVVSLDRDAFRYPNPALTATQSFAIQVSGPTAQTLSVVELPTINLLDLLPAAAPAIPDSANLTIVLYTTTLKLARLSNIPHGFINHTTWSPQSPALINLARPNYDVNQLVPYISLSDPPLWIDVVLNNIDEDDHPFHLHGHSPHILQTYSPGWGLGSWNPYQASSPPGGELDLKRALKRDTFVVPRRGYVVLRFRADNGGLWMLHCHVLWHLGSGMAMAFEVGRDVEAS